MEAYRRFTKHEHYAYANTYTNALMSIRTQIATFSGLSLVCLVAACLLSAQAILHAQSAEAAHKVTEIADQIAGQSSVTHWIIFCIVLSLIFAGIVKWLIADREKAALRSDAEKTALRLEVERAAERHSLELQRERDASEKARTDLIQYMQINSKEALAVQREFVAVSTKMLSAIDAILDKVEIAQET